MKELSAFERVTPPSGAPIKSPFRGTSAYDDSESSPIQFKVFRPPLPRPVLKRTAPSSPYEIQSEGEVSIFIGRTTHIRPSNWHLPRLGVGGGVFENTGSRPPQCGDCRML